MRYGRDNPLRLALPILRKRFSGRSVVPQRGGIWVGTDAWVTYGSPEDVIVDTAYGSSAGFVDRVMAALAPLKRRGVAVLRGSKFSL